MDQRRKYGFQKNAPRRWKSPVKTKVIPKPRLRVNQTAVRRVFKNPKTQTTSQSKVSIGKPVLKVEPTPAKVEPKQEAKQASPAKVENEEPKEEEEVNEPVSEPEKPAEEVDYNVYDWDRGYNMEPSLPESSISSRSYEREIMERRRRRRRRNKKKSKAGVCGVSVSIVIHTLLFNMIAIMGTIFVQDYTSIVSSEYF